MGGIVALRSLIGKRFANQGNWNGVSNMVGWAQCRLRDLVAIAIKGCRERLEPCPLREEILCGVSTGKRTRVSA